MAASPSLDRSAFLTHLRASGLVSEEQLASINSRYADVHRTRSLARALVQDGTLTRFQAERLLAGRSSGFLLGQYRILDQLGRGGMGRVYRAEHQTMKRIVALKVLAPDLLKTERAVTLFLHEVRAVGQLVHPNIVTAFDANQVDGRYYLVLEFVDGPNLDQLVRKQGPLSVGLACDYIRQVAIGLQSAHLQGMLHRDIKPANILVQWHGLNGDSSPGLVKISDFGLARLAAPGAAAAGLTDETRPGTIFTTDNTVMGTPDYLSPEQSRCLHRTDIRSDLYSLGCTFYFLLTGRVPFPGGTALDKLIRHSTEPAAPISSFRDDVPAPVLAIVERLMAKHPNDRFATPADLAEALQPYAVSGPTPWAPPSKAAPEYELELVDSAPTPTGELVPLGGVLSSPDVDLSALSNTVTGDGSPTPRPVPNHPSRLIHRPDPGARRRLQVALISALAVVGTLVVLAVLAALSGGR